jgi:hypothetical protein
MSELTVILKDEHKTVRQKFLLYEVYGVSETDDVIRNCIIEAKKNFGGDPDSVQVKIHLQVQ